MRTYLESSCGLNDPTLLSRILLGIRSSLYRLTLNVQGPFSPQQIKFLSGNFLTLFGGKRLLENGPCTFKVNICRLECIPKRIRERRVGSFQP